jgi:hypothetical protein
MALAAAEARPLKYEVRAKRKISTAPGTSTIAGLGFPETGATAFAVANAAVVPTPRNTV